MSKHEVFDFLCEWASVNHPARDNFNADSIADGQVVAELLYTINQTQFGDDFMDKIGSCNSSKLKHDFIREGLSVFYKSRFSRDPTQVSQLSADVNEILSKELTNLVSSKSPSLQRCLRRMEREMDEFVSGDWDPVTEQQQLSNETVQKLEAKLSSAEEDNSSLKREVQYLSNELKMTQVRINELHEEKRLSRERRNAEDILTANSIREKENYTTQLEDKVAQYEEYIDSARKEMQETIDDLQKELTDAETNFNVLNRKLVDTENNALILQSQLDRYLDESPDHQRVMELELKISEIDTVRTVQQRRIQVLEEEVKQCDHLHMVLLEKNAVIRELELKFDIVQEKNVELNQRISNVSNELLETQSEMSEIRAELDESRSRLAQSDVAYGQGSDAEVVEEVTLQVSGVGDCPLRNKSIPLLVHTSTQVSTPSSNKSSFPLTYLVFVPFFVIVMGLALVLLVRVAYCHVHGQPFSLLGQIEARDWSTQTCLFRSERNDPAFCFSFDLVRPNYNSLHSDF